MKRLTILLAAAAWGCTPEVKESAPPLPLSRRAAITFKSPPPDAETSARIVRFLDLADRVHLGTFSSLPNVRSVLIYPGETLPEDLSPRPLEKGESLHGLGGGGVVHLPSGGSPPLRAALHELHHVAVPDPGHEGDEWSEVDRVGHFLAEEFFE